MTSFAATRSAHRPLRAACLSAVTVLMALSAIGGAQAATFSGPITVSLIAPGGITDGTSPTPDPINLTQTLTPPSGTITPGDGGDVGGFMLSLESIKLNGTSIVVRAAEGASNGTTGYLGLGGQHAHYEFDGLAITGQVITGLSYALTDTSGSGAGTFVGVSNGPALTTANFISLKSPTSIEFDLDQIHFKDRGQGESNNFADFTISLTTSPVPEPSSAALALIGMAAVASASGLRARRRARASA